MSSLVLLDTSPLGLAVHTRGAAGFAEWLADRLAANDEAALVGWKELAPQAQRAHPSDEHFLPLLVAYGAAGEHPRVDRIHREIASGALAMDAYRFRPTVGA